MILKATNRQKVNEDKELFDILVELAPSWVSVREHTNSTFRCVAAPIRGSGRATRNYHVSIERRVDGRVVASEQLGHMLLPSFCPLRHINADGTFCLGFRAGQINEHSCAQWWKKMRVFLLLQETAHATGRWPEEAQLSHGKAGETQLEAEELAEQLDMVEAYENAVYRNRGEVFLNLKNISRNTGKLLNGRAACICGRKRRRGRRTYPRLRRECTALGPCLVLLEAKRRQEEMRFWESVSDRACCGTMENCPLQLMNNSP